MVSAEAMMASFVIYQIKVVISQLNLVLNTYISTLHLNVSVRFLRSTDHST